MEMNKYDLVEWVAEIIATSGLEICDKCMFKNECFICSDKETLIKELLKKYNL